MITVPAGSSLTLRCPGVRDRVLISLAEVRAGSLAELPPIAVLSLDGPGVRRVGVLEIVTTAGQAWVEGELRDDLFRVTGDVPADIVQRRGARRRAGAHAVVGTVQIEALLGGRRLIAVTGRVEDISTDGLLLRATADRHGSSMPPDVERALLHIVMPWGELTTAVTVVDQRADLVRGTYEWMAPDDAAALAEFCVR